MALRTKMLRARRRVCVTSVHRVKASFQKCSVGKGINSSSYFEKAENIKTYVSSMLLPVFPAGDIAEILLNDLEKFPNFSKMHP